MSHDPEPTLSPLPIRLLMIVVMVLVALAAIWVMDRQAMIRMQQYNETHLAQQSPATQPVNQP